MNKCGVTFTYGDPMHPSAVTSISSGKNYTYDPNGNMQTGGGRIFDWNVDNRVRSVTLGGSVTSMQYDYTGMRVKKDGAGGLTLYPFQGYEIAPNGEITKFIRIGTENFAARKKTGTAPPVSYFYHNDHLGGVNVVTDITGNRVQLNEYDPWGGVSRSEGSIDPDTRFTGQKLDAETGLYYYGGRYYDPEISRFISPDPYVQDPDDPQNLNRYSYVLNDTINYTDPSGYFYMGKGIADGPFGTGIAGQIFGKILGALFTFMTGNPVIGMIATWMMNIAQNPNAALSAGNIINIVSSVITGALSGGSSPGGGPGGFGGGGDCFVGCDYPNQGGGSLGGIGGLMLVNAVAPGGNKRRYRMDQAGIDFIIRHEGFRENVYRDPGRRRLPTIGYGHQIFKGETIVGPLTEDEALQLLRRDLAIRVNPFLDRVTVPLSQNQVNALAARGESRE